MIRQPLNRILVAYDGDTSTLVSRFPDIVFDIPTSRDSIRDLLPLADAALIGGGIPLAWFDGAHRLKWIQAAGAGVEWLAKSQLATREIVVTNGRGVMSSNMAEHVIGLMLTFARQLHVHWESQRSRTWQSAEARSKLFELAGQTAVIVGTGMIGQDLARRLQAFDMEVIGVRRHEGDIPGFDEVVTWSALDTVAPRGDHVISAVPHTPETVGMWNAARFARMRNGAHFYNVGRGTSVVQADLIAALESGRLGGAGLDVATPEPLPPDDPLWGAPNLLITHHSAGATPKFAGRVMDLFEENIRLYQAGLGLRNMVDLSQGY